MNTMTLIAMDHTKKMSFSKKQFVVLLSLFVFIFSPISAQIYEDEFPLQYNRALGLKSIYEMELHNQGVLDTDFYLAIIFPEMQRYTEKRDKLETLINTITYTTISDFEGCSIGPFQMKPNFIKQLEDFIIENPDFKNKYSDLLIDKSSDFLTRYERIIRLDNTIYITRYLMAFVDMCICKYGLDKESKETQLKYLSAIYNSGFKDSLEDYEAFLTEKSFPNGFNSSKSKWNYSELAVYYYNLWNEN